MDYAVEQTVRSQLASNEKLLWTGQPRGGVRLRATDALLRLMSDITVAERPDGSGTITLGPSTGMYSWFGGSGWPGASRYQPPAFEMIEDVRRVNGMLRDAQSRAD